jgi:NOL1/NOP2/fmu family ribosome biogenesis protein
MHWVLYKDDLFIPVEIKALTIEEAIKAGLTIAREVLGSVDRYCAYEVGGEVIIEYWRGREVAVKLIRADDPASALMHYYNAERVGLVKCVDIGQ